MKKTTGERIREARKKKGWSQVKLGKALEVSQQMIAQFENSKKSPKVETLEKIAKALDVPVGELLFGESTNVAKISDENSSVYINMDNIHKSAMEFFDSNPHIGKLTPQQIESVLSFYDEIAGQVPHLPEPEIMQQYKKLNSAGKQKAVEYTTDLAQMPKYQQDPDAKK